MKGLFYLSIAVGIWVGLLLTTSILKNARFSGWDISALRFFGASLVVLPWLFLGKIKLVNIKIFVLLSLLGGVSFVVLFSLGLKGSNAISAAFLMINGIPIFFWITSRIINKEKLGIVGVSGVFGSLLALGLVGSEWKRNHSPITEIFFLAAVCTPISLIIGQLITKKITTRGLKICLI